VSAGPRRGVSEDYGDVLALSVRRENVRTGSGLICDQGSVSPGPGPQNPPNRARCCCVSTEPPASVRVPESVLWQEVDGQIVLLDLDSDTYHAFNDVGSRMWRALDESGDTNAAFEQLRETYEVDETVLRRDLLRFVDRLVESGLLRAA
jgi:Coenzyme PQQ synthesis protein D (PqqD)